MALLGIQISLKIMLLEKGQLLVEMFYEVVLDSFCPWHHWYVGIYQTNQLITVWFQLSSRLISLYDNPALLIPVICHLVAMDSLFGKPLDSY